MPKPITSTKKLAKQVKQDVAVAKQVLEAEAKQVLEAMPPYIRPRYRHHHRFIVDEFTVKYRYGLKVGRSPFRNEILSVANAVKESLLQAINGPDKEEHKGLVPFDLTTCDGRAWMEDWMEGWMELIVCHVAATVTTWLENTKLGKLLKERIAFNNTDLADHTAVSNSLGQKEGIDRENTKLDREDVVVLVVFVVSVLCNIITIIQWLLS